MTTEPPPRYGPRFSGLALAWLLLLGLLAAGAGYVLVLPAGMVTDATRGGLVVVALPPPLEAEDLAVPPVAAEAPVPKVAAPAEAPPADAPPADAPPAKASPEEAPPAVAPPGEPAASEVAEAAGGEEPPAAPTEPADTQPARTQQALAPRAIPSEVLPSWRRNSQPFAASEEKPRIAVILTGLGLSESATEAAIKGLPGSITLSFSPYSRKLNQWVALARVSGHEVMLDLPMEPTSYPDDDPGPWTLLTALSAAQNLERLSWMLRRTTGYVGVATVMGSRFLTSEDHLNPVLAEIKARGLLFLDSRASDASIAGALAAKLDLPSAVNDRFLDRAQASRAAVDARLVQLERVARTEGAAVAMGRPYPVTIERLREWSVRVERRGFVLAPISAVVGRRQSSPPPAAETGSE